jgi:hypothetical protein
MKNPIHTTERIEATSNETVFALQLMKSFLRLDRDRRLEIIKVVECLAAQNLQNKPPI